MNLLRLAFTSYVWEPYISAIYESYIRELHMRAIYQECIGRYFFSADLFWSRAAHQHSAYNTAMPSKIISLQSLNGKVWIIRKHIFKKDIKLT